MITGKNISSNFSLNYSRMTANLIAAYVSHNRVPASDLPALIAAAGAAFTGLQLASLATGPKDRKVTQAQIQASITYEALISFEDGKPYQTIKRHLTTRGLTPETYRAKWGLPPDYPMFAPAYGVKRSKIAKRLALRRNLSTPASEAGPSSG
ncbi:MucR family transcriptional regulator [Methylobacterium radiotolerans]|uniref:Transcriptional regulator, MucR family n=1 Tax=Methylobacterium radiotolerans (strain ATCC 27329 / DSM 1819 / JCM 2831 / NBRC 15690 / NCIMB 10815 / 0-1) TaxID=426355 RepID=B1MA34_METRJ|nr:MucR family transcriptional regulator [Methylobacterium radiotolerans]ACB28359.1 transcriptional regulator, MucR family [Methylobacterium radiotolerans JCM 2831]GEN01748.1 transcriptional regulator [Methylobacterium radiotolerans]